jgi:hypothetical protein
MASITLTSSILHEVAYMSFVENSYMYTHSNIQANRNLHKGEKLKVVEWPLLLHKVSMNLHWSKLAEI